MTTSFTIPAVTGHTESAVGTKTRIDLTFNTAMAAGQGKIYVTDGSLQTVIDPVTGELATRIAGASHTVAIDAASLHFSGSLVYTDALDLAPGHQYSVLIDAGALTTSAGRLFAGLARPGQVRFTTPDAPVASGPVLGDIALLTDLGQSANDYLTSGDLHQLKGTINGTLAAGQSFELLINGSPIGSPYLTVKETLDGTTHGYAWTYDGALPDGVATVTARIMGGGSVLQESHVNITLDRTSPAVATSPDGQTAFDVNSPVVITFNEAVYWADSEGTADQLVLKDADNNLTYITLTSDNLTDGGTRLTIAAADLHLAAGTDYRIYLPSTMKDLAGNLIGEYSIAFHTAAASDGTVTGPHAYAASVVNAAGSYNAGKPIEIRVGFDTAVTLVDGANPKLVLNNGRTADFYEVTGSGEVVFTYTVGAGDDVAKLDITDASSLVGSFKSLGGDLLVAGGLQFHGLTNAGGLSDSGITIDTIAPAALSAPVLAAESDSGSSNSDRITNDATPTLTGTGAEAYAKIELYDGDTVVAETTSLADGTWSITLPEADALLDGVHALSVRQTDAAGNAGARSEAINVTIDTVAPTLVGWTQTVALGDSFQLWLSEKVNHDSVPGQVTVYDSISSMLVSPFANDPSFWNDNVTHDGHVVSAWTYTPSHSGWVQAALSGVKDAAGNVATIELGHYEFTVSLVGANLLPPILA